MSNVTDTPTNRSSIKSLISLRKRITHPKRLGDKGEILISFNIETVINGYTYSY
jgi:hypothetical protein